MNKFISISSPVPPEQFIAVGMHKKLGEVSRITTPNGKLFLRNANAFCKSRVSTFYSKEPCTITYLDSLPREDMLIDIGANIGVYSMYAIAEGMSRVISIEPSIFNSYELFLNRILNDKEQRCYPINAAVANSSQAIEMLALNGIMAGHSFNQVGGGTNAHIMQPVMGLPLAELDRLREGRATHIKLDVDGIESVIVEAIKEVVDLLNVRSIQVEFDQNKVATRDSCETLFEMGFNISAEQLAFRREGLRDLDEVKTAYANGEYMGNVLFSRDAALFDRFKTYF